MALEERFKFFMDRTYPDGKIPEKEESFIVSGFGCHQDQVVSLVKDIFKEAGIQKDVVGENEVGGIPHCVGTVVVPIRCSKGHNYSVGDPVVVTDVYKEGAVACMRIDGSIGNYLPTNAARKATEEEIRQFADDFKGTIIFSE